MDRQKNIVLGLVFLLLMLLAGCGSSSGSGVLDLDVMTPDDPGAEVTAATIPPEPTNPLPEPTEVVAAGSPCSVGGQHQQIDKAYADYQAERASEENAILGLVDWSTATASQIASECNSPERATTDPETLTALLAELRQGGYVIYVRHTHTDRSRGDENVGLGQCDLQRILSDRGREEALMIRNAYGQLELPIDRIISTQYCRTLETAILAFGVPELILRTELHATLPEWLATEPEAGHNTIIVAHIGTIRDRVGLDDTFDEGDSLIYRPTGDGSFEFMGRIGLFDWPLMATLDNQ